VCHTTAERRHTDHGIERWYTDHGDNEIYLTPAFSAPSLSDVWLYEHVGYASWDPVAFTDGVTHNVHQDKVLLIRLGTPAEAVRFPLSDLVYLPDQLRKKMQAPRHVRIPIGSWDMNADEFKTVSFGFTLDLSKVSSVSHVIVGNNSNIYLPTYNGSVTSWINIVQPGSAFMVSSRAGNPNFSGTSQNRGWIDITLV